jgi:hypothetical protein
MHANKEVKVGVFWVNYLHSGSGGYVCVSIYMCSVCVWTLFALFFR